MEKGRSVTLKHLLIKEKRYIGLQFNTDKMIHALVKQLTDVKWSNTYNMAYILNTKQNLDSIFKVFKVWFGSIAITFLIKAPQRKTTDLWIFHGFGKGNFQLNIGFVPTVIWTSYN